MAFMKIQDHIQDIIAAAMNIFCSASSTREDLLNTLDSLTLFVQTFDSSYEPLVAKVLAYDWYSGDCDVISKIVVFLNKLASAQVSFLEMIFTGIVRKMIPRKVADCPNTFEFVSATAVGTIAQLLNTVPNSILKLPPIIAKSYPYIKKPKDEISGYVKNLLDLCSVFPALRGDLLMIIIEELVKLDVHATRQDIEEVQQSSCSAIGDSDEIFSMETNSAEETRAADEETHHEMGSRLDDCMTHLFDFISTSTQTKRASKNGIPSYPTPEKLYQELLVAFHTKVLPVYACCHTQFLLFYLCARQQKIGQNFMGWLWLKFSDPSVPAILRQTCACYMASMVSRGKFISIEDTQAHLLTWLHWISAYMDTQEIRKQSWSVHGTFYSICQAVFYVVAFRLKEFLCAEGGHQFLKSLNLERIVNCRLNPLKFCFSHVVENFALVTRNYQLAFCYSVIDRNKRQKFSDGDSTAGQNPLEGFFPFDPYVLRRSKVFVTPFYRDYRGLTEEEEEVVEGMSEDNLSESFSPRSIERSKDLLWYGTSPGFKHG